ncbi:ABC transporter permease [Niabella drilacis]|uniref:Putative ABC transport system permease protein n=1 Tax=Niabella drilacis (strain DSM 25811 / CCM 8410 / CCUG 62505 / LMG 26954 / E90) TaxID=1285928 RepID=A0A1G7AI07_NIADE|nr:ABC transporter permease [Niabella drilacis]SDE14360.1 putative ABC transport system permease protein [Niabella drilacis]
MIRNYLKTAWRQFKKNKLTTGISVTALVLGFSTVMVLAAMVYQFKTADSQFAHRDNMYYLRSVPKEGGLGGMQTTYPLLGEIVKTCPQVVAASHYQQWYQPWLKNGQHEIQDNTTAFVDTAFLKVFPFPLKYGNRESALAGKFSIVLSEENAEKLFGNENPLGKTIAADDTTLLTVTGVLQHIPGNTSIKPGVLLTTAFLEDSPGFKDNVNWYNGFAVNYLRIRPGTDMMALETAINKIVRLNYSKERQWEQVIIRPFSRHFADNADEVGKSVVTGSLGTILFILTILVVNLINLNAGNLYRRAKEVAVKKIVGGSKRGIIVQFFTENLLVVFVSLALAVLFSYFLLVPFINSTFGARFGDMEFSLNRDYPLVLLFLLLAFVIAAIVAVLPAIRMLSLKISDAVKGKIVSGGGRTAYVRNIFITLQFLLSVIIIYVAIILARQLNYMKAGSLGFNKGDVAVVDLDLAFKDPKTASSRFNVILNKLRNHADVKSFSVNRFIPTAYGYNTNAFVDRSAQKEVWMFQGGADAGYFQTYDIPVSEGRPFDNSAADSIETRNVIINKAAEKAFGWTNAVGRQIIPKSGGPSYTIIGVTNDFVFQNFPGKVEPLIHYYTGKQALEGAAFLSLNIAKGKAQPVLSMLEKEFKEMPGKRAFNYDFISDRVSKQYQMLDSILKMTQYAGFITIFIAAIGMLGLITILLRLKVKEIGVRKILGGSVAGIATLLSKSFLVMVMIASVVSVPLASLIMGAWLQHFTYRITISWWMFLGGALMTLLVALITVGTQTIKAAMANPVKSLRSE